MRIKNWEKFQHYAKRRPPWIKLYHDLLDDIDWHKLSGDSAKLLISLWLLASEKDGELPSIDIISFRLRLGKEIIIKLISELKQWIDGDASNMLAPCYQDASTMLAPCKQHARPETET